jgi:hypothetical protein
MKKPIGLRRCLTFAVLLALTACEGGDSGTEGLFDLTVQLTGMDEHVGQRFQLRVVNLRTGFEAGRITAAAIPGASFAVEVPDVFTLRDDHHVDFYADHDGDGSYDAPPTDHAWRVVLAQVTGDETIVFAHSNMHVDVAFP